MSKIRVPPIYFVYSNGEVLPRYVSTKPPAFFYSRLSVSMKGMPFEEALWIDFNRGASLSDVGRALKSRRIDPDVRNLVSRLIEEGLWRNENYCGRFPVMKRRKRR